MKPTRRRVYLFITRQRGSVTQFLIFSHADPTLWDGVQTPGGTVEPGETPTEAALREAAEETGLTQFETEPILIAEDTYENDDEILSRYFFQLKTACPTQDTWTHLVHGEGIDGGLDFFLRWVTLANPEDLSPHFHAYMDRIDQ